MLKTSVAISATSDEAARIEGALKLGIEPDEVAVEPRDKTVDAGTNVPLLKDNFT
jgi:hypothetical protein